MATDIRFRWHLIMLLLPLLALSGCARAEPGCGATEAPVDSYAAHIATAACRENLLWHAPFIAANGRLASMTVSEVETAPLADGATPAWTRVAAYWRSPWLIPEMQSYSVPGVNARPPALAIPPPPFPALISARPRSPPS